jgi:hypothetical protein
MPPEDDEVERLRLENEALRDQVEELEAAEAPGRQPQRVRRVSAWVVLVLACLLAVVSVLVVFVRNEALNTDAYVSTVAPLADDPAIQLAVANRIANTLLDQVDVQAQVSKALPTKAGFLAGPIASGVDATVHQLTLRFTQSSAFSQLWSQANRIAHQQVVALLTDTGTGAVSAKQGTVTLNLGTVANRVKTVLVAQGLTIFNKVPTLTGPTLVLFKSTQLAKAQAGVRALNRLAVLLPILTVLAFAGSVLLARNRRRGLVRAAAGLGVSMAVLLVAFDIGRNQYLHSLPASVSTAAAADAYDIMVANLLSVVRGILFAGVIAAVITVAFGNTWIRAHLGALKQPSWLVNGPFIRFLTAFRRALQWGVVAVGAVILFTWVNPSPLVVIVVAAVVAVIDALIGFAGRRPGGAPTLAAAGASGAGDVPTGPTSDHDTPAPGSAA